MAGIESSTMKGPVGQSNHPLPLSETFKKEYGVHVNLTLQSLGEIAKFEIDKIGLAYTFRPFAPQEIYTINSPAFQSRPAWACT